MMRDKLIGVIRNCCSQQSLLLSDPLRICRVQTGAKLVSKDFYGRLVQDVAVIAIEFMDLKTTSGILFPATTRVFQAAQASFVRPEQCYPSSIRLRLITFLRGSARSSHLLH